MTAGAYNTRLFGTTASRAPSAAPALAQGNPDRNRLRGQIMPKFNLSELVGEEVGGVQNSLEILHRMMAGSGEAHHQTGFPPFAEFAPGPQDGDSNLSAALEESAAERLVALSLSRCLSLSLCLSLGTCFIFVEPL